MFTKLLKTFVITLILLCFVLIVAINCDSYFIDLIAIISTIISTLIVILVFILMAVKPS